MRFVVLLILFMSLSIGGHPAFAEYFKYINKDGVVCYTDDLSQIPEDQRTETKRFDEIKSDPEEEVEEEKEEIAEEETDKADINNRNELIMMQISLDKEFKELKTQREQLMTMQKDLSGEEAVTQFNIKADALNKRVKEFEEKKAAYLTRVQQNDL